MGYWSPSWWAARLPACGLEAGSRVAVVASPVHTGRGSAGGLPGAPCHCALRVQATADRPPPVSRTSCTVFSGGSSGGSGCYQTALRPH